MVLRFTPTAPILDAASDARTLITPDIDWLLKKTSRSLKAVGGVYGDVDTDDQRAAQRQLLDMLEHADEVDLMSWALEGADGLESWLLETGQITVPPFMGAAEHYFRDLLSVFCELAHAAALDPARTEAHTRRAVQRHGSRLDQVDSKVAALGARVERLDSGIAQQPAETIVPADWEALERFQITSVDRLRPDVLPEHQRLSELAAAVGEVFYPLVVLGEGGFGKSVLASQLVKSVRASGVAALLVSCSSIGGVDDISSVEAIDLALGKAASGGGRQVPLRRWLTNHPRSLQSPVVVIDTLDLLLRDDTADHLQNLLRSLSRLARLAVTCREAEWLDLVTDAELLSWPRWPMGLLTHDQVMDWASSFTDSASVDPETAAEFLSSLDQSLRSHRGQSVFGSPLRLAMTCELYAATGALPEHLSVSDLYEGYWAGRIARDRRGRRSAVAERQERAATDVAASIWSHSRQRFVEFVPAPTTLSTGPRRSLQSEGILTSLGGRWGFFHQTFAEFSVAKYLAVRGTDDDLERFHDGLQESRPGYWGVAAHVVQHEVDPERFRQLSDAIPIDRVEGLRLRLASARHAGDDRLLIDLVTTALAQHPQVLAACVDILADVPVESHEQLAQLTLQLLGKIGSGLTSVVRTVAALLLQVAEPGRTALLVEAARVLLDRTEPLGSGVTWPEAPRLVEATVGLHPSAFELTGVLEAYLLLPPPGRAALLRSLRTRHTTSDEHPAILTVLLLQPYPQGGFEEGAALLLKSYIAAGDAMGWTSWRQLLMTQYPMRWDGCQVRATAELARDPIVLEEILDELFSEEDSVGTDRMVNSALFVADRSPAALTDHLLGRPLPRGRQTASAFAQLARKAAYPDDGDAPPLGDTRESQLMDRLLLIAPHNPTKVWPPLIAIAAKHPAAFTGCLAILADGHRAGHVSPATSRAVINALYIYATPALAETAESAIGELLSGLRDDARAGFDGWIAATSLGARDRLLAVFLTKSAQRAANTAAKRVKEWADVEPVARTETTRWITTLLGTPHGHALRLLLQTLTQRLDRSPPIDGLLELLVGRLAAALRQHDDGQVVEWLVNALAECLRRWPPTPSQKEAVLGIFPIFPTEIQRQLDQRNRQWVTSVYAQWITAITTLGRPCTTKDGAIDLVVDAVTSVNLDDVGRRASRTLASLFVREGANHPLAWSRIEGVWPSTTAGVRAAIVEALLTRPFPGAETRAMRLARDPLCPQASANQVLRRYDAGVG